MGRKKRNRAQLKPFCFYCDRDFDDEKVLIQHQKAKHFKCSECNRKLDTATGLVVHMLQVHKETISRVPNANTGRENPDLIIHGMDGVPIELIGERQAKLDQERGAVRHSKSAHTTFGMSVMSGFFRQLSGIPGAPPAFPGMPNQLMHQQFAANFGGPGGQPNPFAFNQFMAQMQQSPQAAFTAMFGLPAPKIDPNQPAGSIGSLPSMNAVPSGPGLSLQPSSILPPSNFAPTLQTPGAGFVSSGRFSSINLSAAPQQAPSTTDSRLPAAFNTALNPKTGRIVFDPQDDTISPEETRSEWPQYVNFKCETILAQ